MPIDGSALKRMSKFPFRGVTVRLTTLSSAALILVAQGLFVMTGAPRNGTGFRPEVVS